MAPGRGPAVPRRRLGAELRRLREAAGLLIEQVATRLECSTSKISRLETGKGIPKARDVRDLLDIYNVTDHRIRDRLIRWVREGQQQGWWEKYSDLLRADKLRLDHLCALEADASVARTFQTSVVPGLLQTRAYARCLLAALNGYRLTAGEIDRLADLRMDRQQVLNRSPDPLRLCCVLDEVVLLRSVGGPDVMRGQLRRLLAVDMPTVTVRVLPLSWGPHRAMIGPFTVLEFADMADRDVVYIESHAGGTYLEQPADVEFHSALFQECEEAALDLAESANLIAARIAALE
jgi:transcriptional regulator with XRE-family HTH domain